MKRYRVVAAGRTDENGREWDVVDTTRRCCSDEDCPGVTVASRSTRAAARTAANELEAEARSA